MGASATRVGLPVSVVTDTFTVLIAHEPAAHAGSSTMHGGIMVGPASTVLA